MAVTSPPVNEEYEPTDYDRRVLRVLYEGRSNPLYIREETDMPKQRVNETLQRLQSAGWVTKVTRGLYELDERVPEIIDDPAFRQEE